MNYNHTSETSETFDPDSKVVRSTQTVEQNASDANSTNSSSSVASALPNQSATGGADNTKSTSGRTEETTNYEISKTTKTSTIDGGTVKKLSVAVVVDGTKEGDYHPRTPTEMKQIEALVKSAIGFDGTRGDLVQVTSMSFAKVDMPSATAAPAPFLGLDSAYWFKIIEVGILSLTALLIGFFVARPLIQRMFAPVSYAVAQAVPGTPSAAQLPAPASADMQPGASPQQLPAPRENMIDISRIEGQVRESSVRKVGEVVQSHPEEALAILRTWLHQPV